MNHTYKYFTQAAPSKESTPAPSLLGNMSDFKYSSFYISASLATFPLLALWSWRQRRLNAIEAANMAQTPAKTVRVVIIGGSWAGINVAHGLLKQVPNAKVVLINPTGE